MSLVTASTPPSVASGSVLVIGGGVAGLAAATRLAEQGWRVTVLESRTRLGGRASSFVDQETGETIDNCQHVAMGCCTAFLDWADRVGILPLFQRETALTFLAPGVAPYRFAAGWLPAPAHLLGAFCGLPYLSWWEKLQFARGVRALQAADPAILRGVPLDRWLAQQGQSARVITRAWEVLLISALSESLDRIDAAYARKVLVDGFLATRTGWEVYRPLRPLEEMFSGRVQPALQQLGVELRLNAGVAKLEWLATATGPQISGVLLRDGTRLQAEQYVLAVPWYRVNDLLGPELPTRAGLPDLAQIQAAPITSVHLWVDRPFLQQPHMVLVDRLCQWIFSSPEAAAGEGEPHRPQPCPSPVARYQVVISASRMLAGNDRQAITERVWSELQEIFPAAQPARLWHARVVTEHRAVFSPLPGIDAYRPAQQTSIPNLQLAGDWTQTGWPATLESAVRSGELAAQNILQER